MHEISAAMGITNLEDLNEFIEKSYHNYKAYQKGLDDLPGIRLLEYDAAEKNNYQYIILEMDETEASLSRDQLVQILHAENILARRYFYPGCHRMEPYKTSYPRAGFSLPETERKAKRVLALPTGTAISPDMVKEICGIIRFIISHGKEIKQKIGFHENICTG
jgi:dTDP-4-amino-4,6-dideoxygalactose transaminase